MRPTAFAIFLSVLSAAPAFAQRTGPLPAVVVDARVLRAGLGADETTATALGVAATTLPARGLGGVLGVHAYPMRRTKLSLGVGGEMIWASASFQAKDAKGDPVGLPIERRLSGFTGAVSLNFGDVDGWSYVSAGMGPLRFDSFLGEAAPDAAPTKLMQHFGAGARWFPGDHVAVCFDLRFYLTRPEITSATHAGRGRARVMIMSVGVAIK